MANDIIDIIVTDNSDNVQINATPNLISINVSQTSGNIIGSNYFLASTFGALPITGDTTTLYVINDTSLMYRWSGSAYTQINSSAVVAWGQILGTLSGQTDLQNALNAKAPLASPTFTGTVSGVTKTMVGLSNVDNTSDANKPVSSATQTALDFKANIASPTFTGTVSGVTKAMVGLGNVDNTTDLNKPISTATQSSLDTKAPIASPTFTGTVGGITKDMVGLSNVDNTTDANKPISSATQTALDTKAPLASPAFTGTVTGITKSMVGLGNVDNTSDLSKPISTATQSALNLKYDASNPSGYTTNTGTVTSVSGTGTVSGLSLSGSVTTSGNITLGGTLSLTSGNVTTALGYTPYDATNPSGYISGITSGNVTTALGYTPENAANKGVANGYASLDGGGLVPSSQLPSYVDDVLEFANLAGFPASGTTGKIYVALDTNKIYRWSGATYIEVSPTVGTIWGGITGTLSNQADLQSVLDAKQDDLNGTGFVKASGTTISYDNTNYYPFPAGTTSQYVRGDGTLETFPSLTGFVPYTGATTNVNLGTHSLTAADLVINHPSGSGVAASITKGGNGEALTVIKSSGSGNAASITGGITLLDELHLNTDLADAYIASAATWNAKQSALTFGNLTEATSSVLTITGGTGAVIGSGTSIQVKQSSSTVNGFLSSTDWNTFNNKQATVTLTTTGTSGAATFSGGTLNIPNYGTALSGYLPLTGGTLTGALGGTSASFSSTLSATSNISLFSNSLNGTSIKIFTSNNFPLNGNGFLLSLFGNTILTNNILFNGGAYKYDQNGTGASIRIAAGNSNSGDINFNTFASGTAGATATEVNRMVITSAGNVGIGITSPSQALSVEDTILIKDSGSSASQLIFGDAANDFAGRIFYNHGSDAMQFFVNADERMRITSAGTVAIGSTTRANVWGLLTLRNTLNAAGSMWGIGPDTNNSLTVFNPSNVGVYIVDGGVAWVANSDERLKTDLVPIENAINKVSLLRSVIGRYKTDEIGTKRPFLIAQDVLEVLPEAVTNNNTTGYLGVSYTEIIPLLVASIKELSADLTSAKQQIDILKNK